MDTLHTELAAARLGLQARIRENVYARHLVVYHRADHDGVFAGAIVSSVLAGYGVQDVVLCGWDFGDGTININLESNRADVVWIVDLPVPVVLGTDLVQKVVWIDHHKSSIEAEQRQFAGYRSTELCAAALCWHLLVSPDLPELVYHVDRWDRWVHEGYGDTSVDVHYGLMCKLKLDDPDQAVSDVRKRIGIDGMTHVFIATPHACYNPAVFDQDAVRELSTLGRMVQDFWKSQMDSHCVPVIEHAASHGIVFKAINSCIRGSIVFGSQEGGYMMVWCRLPNGHARVSMYAGADVAEAGVDLSKIAQEYGGGGHVKACGFQMPCTDWLVELERMRDAYEDMVSEARSPEHLS